MKQTIWSFCQAVGIPYQPDEPMSRHTTFHIGGPADALISPDNTEQLAQLLRFVTQNNIPWMIVGQGSNLLVGDGGIRGAVIRMERLKRIREENGLLVAEAGALLAKVCARAARSGKAGLAFACGIPGCVGGALRMNAGAYGGEMAQVVAFADCMDTDGHIERLSPQQLDLSYRHSRFCEDKRVIVRVGFSLPDGDEKTLLAEMEDYLTRRKAKQPLEYPSAGSTFKRPKGHYAGTLIEQCGLKGLTVGGAQVSEKHAGFVINASGASAYDVKQLMAAVQKTVMEMTGVWLEPEVIFVGED